MIIIIPTFIFVIIWIMLNIYHSYISSTIPETVNVQISPITPSFDTKTISLLKERIAITPEYQLNPLTNLSVTPSPVPVSSGSAVIANPIISTNSATQQQASSGGNLTP
jgi:hypothetical protein